MGKTVAAVVGIVAAVAIAVVAPYLAPLALGALGITATATAVAVATALITATLSIGLSLGFRALGIGAPSTRSAVGPPQVFRQTISNSFIVYGKRRVGGLLVFYHPRNNSGDHYRYFVIAVAGHRCDGVVSWMLNDETVTVDGSNKVTSGKYANRCWLWFQRGLASETANATFVSECGGKWTSAHKGNGIAAIYAKFSMSESSVEAGMPNITAVIEGKDDIRDPRDDTEGYSANASMVFYDWMTLPREEGGFGAYADEMPDDDWQSAQANVCDEVVDSAARYELHGVITTGAPPNEIRDVMVVNQAGSYTYSGGKHLMRPGYYVPPSNTLSEDDLAGAIQISPFLPGDSAANEVSGSYVKPTDRYQAAALTPATITPAPTDIRQIDVDLAFVTNKDQGDRILSIMLRRAQAEKSVVWPMNISGLKVRALDTVQLDSARYGLSNYAWSVTNWSLSADWGVVLSLREENAEIYDDPTPVAPVTPPTVDVADPLLSPAATTTLISGSYVTDVDPLDGLLQATASQITLESHTRTYSDKAPVSVTGGTITTIDDGVTALLASTVYHVYYDDPNRAGGAVNRKATRLSSTAATSAANPYRHYVGSITTASGGGTTTASGASPSGWSDGNWRYNTA